MELDRRISPAERRRTEGTSCFRARWKMRPDEGEEGDGVPMACFTGGASEVPDLPGSLLVAVQSQGPLEAAGVGGIEVLGQGLGHGGESCGGVKTRN